MNLNGLLQEAISEAKKLNIPVSEKIKSNVLTSNAQSFLGKCRKSGNSFTIYISNALLGGGDTQGIKQTLAHEILHTCDGCMNHGNTWKNYASKMNRAYSYNISRTANIESFNVVRTANYVVVCTQCGNKTYRNRMSKLITHMHQYRCNCGGKLRLDS